MATQMLTIGTHAAHALAVSDLRVEIEGSASDIVDEVSFLLPVGETLGIAGESGSGKTTVAVALLGAARSGAVITGGSVVVSGRDLLSASEQERRRMRGRLISYVPQDPSTALSPGMRIGRQIAEVVVAHLPDEPNPLGLVRAALQAAQLPSGDDFLRRYPHQLSGGQQQRVTIAMALVCRPGTVVMDEPTTGLDVTTQARLLTEIRHLASSSSMAIVYVSHDLSVIRNLASVVAVMYGGRIIESAPVDELFREPRHPYTRRLLEAIPRIDRPLMPRGIPGSAVEPWNRPPGCPFAPRCEFRVARCETEMPPIEVHGARTIRCWRWSEVTIFKPNLTVPPTIKPSGLGLASFPARRPAPPAPELLTVSGLQADYVQRAWLARVGSPDAFALREVSFAVARGASVGVVGESGSGKTTLMRCIAGLHRATAGEIKLGDVLLEPMARRRAPDIRRRIQLVPQNPDASLNPRHSVADIIGRPLRQFLKLSRAEQRSRVRELLEQVRLQPTTAARMPRELSGGEKQRVAIARALAAKPDLLLCDEITSALDVAVQAGILNLLQELSDELGMTAIFVSHDLAVVQAISDAIVVMQDGHVREVQETASLFASPRDPYTKELLAAIPRLRVDDHPSDAIFAAQYGDGGSL